MVFAFPSPMLTDRWLWQFITELTCSEPVPRNDAGPPWFEPGIVSEISMATYFNVLELSRPKWQHASLFVSGESTGPGRLFWRQGDKFFGRQLTADQSRTFGELAETGNSVQTARSEVDPYAPGQEQFSHAYIEQQRRLDCPSCGEEPFLG